MPTASTNETVTAHAHALGCPPLVFLSGNPTPEHLEYLDLLPTRKTANPFAPDAVAEFQGRAVLYLVDGNGPNGTRERIAHLQTLLANRGEHACLGVTKPGSLDIYPINLDRRALQSAKFRTVSLADEKAPIFFQSLATGTFELDGRPEEADYIYKTIHDLLASASEELAGTTKKAGISGLEVLSTTGRALFFRFLIDRKIVFESELPDICPGAIDLKDVFSSPNKAASASAWLDETFNGDLLPLVHGLSSGASATARLRAYRDYYKSAEDKTEGRLFLHLQAILNGWKHVGDSTFQQRLDWDDLDFSHVPIGVLSQVYESFSHQWDGDHAEETSVHYTPRNLARILVNEAFAGVDNPAEGVVLDPACGAGVFLVLAFRRLVQEHWRKHGSRPDIKAIQRILYKQIRGFEVSESALRLAALALYITAIEVNGTQRPPRSLKFPRALRGEVLYDLGHHDGSESRKGFSLGSLGDHVPKHFDGTIDILVTNPPWTRLRADRTSSQSQQNVKELGGQFTNIARHALQARGCVELAKTYKNPDHDPDLPFLWRATEWVRPGGLIAMALPARILFKQDSNGKVARDSILRSLSVTGILNGSDMEKTAVWPNMDLPFMLLFARNSVPAPDHRFHFVSPVRENRLSSRGQFRIDYKSAETVGVRDVVEIPWLLKALAVGTSLDVDIVRRLPQRSVKKYWKDHGLCSGKGYNLAPGLTQQSAQHLPDLLDFELPAERFCLPANLKTWSENHQRATAHAPRDPKIYRAPLVIIPEAQRESRADAKAFLAIEIPLAFSHSFYGFSAMGSNEPNLTASLLYLIVHSQLFQHFCLMRSSRQGVSFRTILKQDVEAFPFVDPKQLAPKVQQHILGLAKSLSTGEKPNWPKLDAFVNSIYGLDDHDTTVIEDTVTFSGPYRSVRERAEHPIEPQDLAIFCNYLEDMLQPLFQLTRQRIHVSPIEQRGLPPWHFVTVSLTSEKPPRWKGLMTRIAEEANLTGASRVVVRIPKDGGLIIGILNQRRFWTRSRARLCSLHIEEHHLDAFPVEAK